MEYRNDTTKNGNMGKHSLCAAANVLPHCCGHTGCFWISSIHEIKVEIPI